MWPRGSSSSRGLLISTLAWFLMASPATTTSKRLSVFIYSVHSVILELLEMLTVRRQFHGKNTNTLKCFFPQNIYSGSGVRCYTGIWKLALPIFWVIEKKKYDKIKYNFVCMESRLWVWGVTILLQTNTYETEEKSFEKYANNWVVSICKLFGLLSVKSYFIETMNYVTYSRLPQKCSRICECPGWRYTTSPRLPQQLTAIELSSYLRRQKLNLQMK